MSKTESVKVNKSKMVREYLAANNGAAAKDVVEHFKNEGVDINKQFVYQTRTHMKNPKSKKRSASAKKKVSSKTAAKQMNHLDSLLVAKKLLASCGGDLIQAKKSLDTLSKLIS